jgi:hypothetical protein
MLQKMLQQLIRWVPLLVFVSFFLYTQISKSKAGGTQTRELVNEVQSCLPKITIGYYPPIEIPLPRPLSPERASGVYVPIRSECITDG